jgi:hypothetical protein
MTVRCASHDVSKDGTHRPQAVGAIPHVTRLNPQYCPRRWARRRLLSALFGKLGGCAHCMSSAGPTCTGDLQRLEACEELRSQEIRGAGADAGQRWHVGTLPWSQSLLRDLVLGAVGYAWPTRPRYRWRHPTKSREATSMTFLGELACTHTNTGDRRRNAAQILL